MKIVNIHKRKIPVEAIAVGAMMETLGSKDDQMWPVSKWPGMKLSHGLEVGSKGGHGPIRYTVEEYNHHKNVKFKFSKPSGFHGFHQFEIAPISFSETLLTHTIKMNTSLKAYFQWTLAIRWLHDALIEDAFDRIENSITTSDKRTQWNWYVRFLRNIMG